jgi:hypothetical protein
VGPFEIPSELYLMLNGIDKLISIYQVVRLRVRSYAIVTQNHHFASIT